MLAGWIGFGILALALLTAVVLGRSIARPVRDLAAAAQAVSTFDFRRAPQAKASAFRELDSAAEAFNAMLSGLRWFETYVPRSLRSEEHTSELQSLMRISYAVFFLKK